MITEKAKDFIIDNSTSMGLLSKVEGRLTIYHVDDNFTTQGTELEYVVGTSARYNYLKKKRKGQKVPPHIELDQLELLVNTFTEEGSPPLEPPKPEVEEIPDNAATPSSSLFELDEDIFNVKKETDPPTLPPIEEADDEENEEDEEKPDPANILEYSDGTFTPNKVIIKYIERTTPARVTDILLHSNSLLTEEELRGMVNAYFQN